jgi:hypothetical protein
MIQAAAVLRQFRRRNQTHDGARHASQKKTSRAKNACLWVEPREHLASRSSSIATGIYAKTKE